MNPPRSDQNHLQSEWLDTFESHPGPVFLTRLGLCRRLPETPLSEAARAARLIHEQNPTEKISLCLSGGVDSEAMARAFLHAGIPFEPYVFRFKDGFNDFDIADALSFCAAQGLTPNILDIDAISYFESGRHWNEAERYQCNSPQLCLHIHLLEQVPGCAVLSWNPPNLEKGDRGIGLPQFKYWSYHRYFEARGRAGVPFFFLYTPELVYSFLRLPALQRALRTTSPGASTHSAYEFKCEAYRQGGFAIENRADKYTGFEKLRRHYDQITGRPDAFNQLFRRPLEEKIAAPRSQISLINENFLFV